MSSPCPCCSGITYVDCCGQYIDGDKIPATPEQLMRSRYTAYSRANAEYIAKTMKSPAIDDFDVTDARNWALSMDWLKLEVLNSSIKNAKGYVEFIAYFSQHGKNLTLHEASEFHLIDGRWYYIDGKAPQAAPRQPATSLHIGRNDPCHCGSGKKYKKCCGL